MLYVAFTLSIINSVLWIVFAVGIRRVFKKLYPFFNGLGQNLTYMPISDRIGSPPKLADAETEKH